MFSYQWDWSSYITVFTGQEQLRYWAKLYWRFLLKVSRWTWVGLELRIHGLILTLYTPLFRLSSSFLATGLLPFYENPIWVRGWFRGVFTEFHHALESLSFLSFSLSPPLVGGNMVESSSWVLTLSLCQSSRLLGFWILETWQSSLTLANFLTLAGVLGSSCLLFLSLVVFRILVGLPDSCWFSGLFWPSWLPKSLHIC